MREVGGKVTTPSCTCWKAQQMIQLEKFTVGWKFELGTQDSGVWELKIGNWIQAGYLDFGCWQNHDRQERLEIQED